MTEQEEQKAAETFYDIVIDGYKQKADQMLRAENAAEDLATLIEVVDMLQHNASRIFTLLSEEKPDYEKVREIAASSMHAFSQVQHLHKLREMRPAIQAYRKAIADLLPNK